MDERDHANNKSMEVVGSNIDKFEFRLGNMKAKLDQIKSNIGARKTASH